VPAPGNALISVDYETLELRTLAQCLLWLFKESRMAQALNSGRDLHLEVAARILGCSYEDAVVRHKSKEGVVKTARDSAKVLNFGLPGGLGADAFVAFARKSYGVKVTSDEAKKLKKAWQKAWPEMKQYFDYISRMTEYEDNKLKQLGTERVRGRLRFTEAANTLFQGLAGSGAKRALYEVCKRAYAGDLPGLYPVAFIHDEILAEAPVDKVHEYGYALADTMCSAMQKYVPDVKITASPVAMNCWSKDSYEKFDENRRLQVWRYSEDKKSD
jgi:DNA polymerase-1